MTDLRPGDIICTRSEGLAGWLIRFGAALRDLPNTHNHVAMYVGPGSDGRPRVIEGRPGGVGYADATRYLSSRWTVDNRDQPKTDKQREELVKVGVGMLGTRYAWGSGIAQAAMISVGAPTLYDRAYQDGEPSPDHVVCSSAWDWGYSHVELASPRGNLWVVTWPAHWTKFLARREWL